nr:agmatine deiminase family protein [Bacteroidota bacterium]
MITDFETNFVYLSALTNADFPKMSKILNNYFVDNKIPFGLLKSTKDYFCRDYMPVQVTKDKFVQFVFNPVSYFQPKEFQYISNPISIQIDNKLIKPVYSRIILDGGNVVKGKDKVIITDKVFSDNKYQMTREEILKELENLLEAEIIIIPSLKDDNTGHADGMIRFSDENTVLINTLGFELDDDWEERFLAVLKEHGLQYKQIPVFDTGDDNAVGIYINYLHVGNLIVVPFFTNADKQNNEALKCMKEYFPGCTVTSVDATSLAQEGGVLNCATWNILK